MQRLIIICGLPGTGKTTLAKALSKELKVACLHKDSIKENLYESLDFSSLADSRKLGVPSVKLLYALTNEQLQNEIDLLIEGPFYFEEDYELFRKWEKDYETKIYSIICSVDEETRKKRFAERERHQAHHDVDRLIADGNHDTPNSEEVYDKLPGKIIRVHTKRPVEDLIKEVLKELK